MKSSITISRAIFAFGVLTVVGLVAVIFASNYALSQLKVGGPLYSKIKLGNDLIADILPPPAYMIEAYLEATLALQDPSTVAARRDRLAQLKKDYDERREFWVKSDLEPVLKTRLVDKSHGHVQRFWNLVEQSFLPALAKADTAQAAKSYKDIAAAYTAHRAVIDDIVKQANDDNAAAEAEATSRVQWFTMVLWSISAFVFFIVGAGHCGCGKGGHSADRQDDGRDAAARQWRVGKRNSLSRPQGRGRRDGGRAAGFQGKFLARSGDGSRTGDLGKKGRGRQESRIAAGGRRFRRSGRKDHQDRVVGLFRY